MPTYEIYGRLLQSDTEFPELTAAAGPRPFPPLRYVAAPAPPPPGGWFTIWDRPDGGPWVRASRTHTGYHVQYCNCAEFDLDLSSGAIAGAPVACSPEMFRHFVVDQVVPLLLSVTAVVLHASAVSVDGDVAAFVGPGGSGKSTLATALCRAGHEMVSDDGLLLVGTEGRTRAIAAYPGVRLWPDTEAALVPGLAGFGRPAATGKQRFRDGLRFAASGVLTHLYVIGSEPSSEIAFEALTPRDAAVELLRQTFRLALDDRRALARQLESVAGIAGGTRAWRVSFPRGLARTPALARAIDAHRRASVTS